uniref:Uncharacterized protein n=1 Tax=Oryza sativa subsp. japonica TaxID=39947 RepID=Q5QML4_ORYSJ|nr:hypothetical protein [Oryza sativa Japonica Group]BAD82287.1 hypothetical protein [Oryza sativa Japonica Group]
MIWGKGRRSKREAGSMAIGEERKEREGGEGRGGEEEEEAEKGSGFVWFIFGGEGFSEPRFPFYRWVASCILVLYTQGKGHGSAPAPLLNGRCRACAIAKENSPRKKKVKL